MSNSIPHNLKAIRAKMDLSQEKFAAKMDVSKGKINQYEQGNAVPSINFLLKLTYLTGQPMEKLLYYNLPSDAFPDNMDVSTAIDPAAAVRKSQNLYDIRNIVDEIRTLQEEVAALKKAQTDQKQE